MAALLMNLCKLDFCPLSECLLKHCLCLCLVWSNAHSHGESRGSWFHNMGFSPVLGLNKDKLLGGRIIHILNSTFTWGYKGGNTTANSLLFIKLPNEQSHHGLLYLSMSEGQASRENNPYHFSPSKYINNSLTHRLLVFTIAWQHTELPEPHPVLLNHVPNTLTLF